MDQFTRFGIILNRDADGTVVPGQLTRFGILVNHDADGTVVPGQAGSLGEALASLKCHWQCTPESGLWPGTIKLRSQIVEHLALAQSTVAARLPLGPPLSFHRQLPAHARSSEEEAT
jgi:hypothetical protein